MSRRRPPARAALTATATAGAAAVAARATYAALRRRPPGGAAIWARTNHRGEAVTLLEGPAVALAVGRGAGLPLDVSDGPVGTVRRYGASYPRPLIQAAARGPRSTPRTACAAAASRATAPIPPAYSV